MQRWHKVNDTPITVAPLVFFRGLPGFCPIFCLLAAEQQYNSNKQGNSVGWDEHLNNVEDFSQQ